MSALKSWGRLLRLSLAPTAIADVVAGAFWGGAGGAPPLGELALLGLASSCTYHGGMALNDWADRAQDARVRPDRPVPSGGVNARAALIVALALLVAGPLLAARVDANCGGIAAGVAACALLYDVAGRGAWLGPALLALCRAGNLGVGIRFGLGPAPASGEPLPWLAFAPALFYGAYVFCVSRVGRLEDADERTVSSPAPWIAGALLALLVALASPVSWVHAEGLFAVGFDPWTRLHGCWGREFVYVVPGVALTLVALFGPARELARGGAWPRERILRTMGMLLRRLLVFTSALVFLSGSRDGALAGALILCGYPLSFALRKVFPPS